MRALNSALAVAVLSVVSLGVHAEGCIKGGAVGGVGGHLAGHHGVAGAVVGCAVGHHMAKKKAEKQQVAAQQAQTNQAGAANYPSTPSQPVAKKHFWNKQTSNQ